MSNRRKVIVAVIVTFFLTLFLISGTISFLFITNYQDLGNLYDVVRHVRGDGLQNPKTKTLVDGAIKGMVNSLNDPYSVYLEPKSYNELNARIKGSFGGVGIVVEARDNKIMVLSVIKGGPADKSGIKAGDTIVKIDGKDTAGMNLDIAASLIRGEEGSKVKLTIAREGFKNPQDYELLRKIIEVPTVEGDLLKGSKIGLVRISQFNSRTGQELKDVLKELKKKDVKGIILDLRDNPGGELGASTEVAENFVPKGPIVYIDYRTEADQLYEANGSNIKIPLVVLVNGGSASAAEIVSGAIKDTEDKTGAVLVGTKTFGKGVVQTIYELKNGAGLKITTARYLTPKKKDINKKGITPDIVIEQPEKSDRDVQLDKAIELIKKKI